LCVTESRPDRGRPKANQSRTPIDHRPTTACPPDLQTRRCGVGYRTRRAGHGGHG
jgi:hypothetical protein